MVAAAFRFARVASLVHRLHCQNSDNLTTEREVFLHSNLLLLLFCFVLFCFVSPQTQLVSVVWQSLMYKEEEKYIVNEVYALYMVIWEFVSLPVWCGVRVIAKMDDGYMSHS